MKVHMSRPRRFALHALLLAAAAATVSVDAFGATLSLVGPSAKVCQLIGDTDWAGGQPTAAQTLTNFGLDAVDLGFPVEGDAGKLYFLFGDALPVTHPLSSVPPDDALGWTTRRGVPDTNTCLDLQLAVSAPKTFAHPAVLPPIQQGSFNVPTGGVFVDDRFYAFFWTDHCIFADVLTPNPDAPLTLPPANAICAETPLNNSVGRSVLAEANPADPVLFHRAAPKIPLPSEAMPSGFVYVSAAAVPHEREPWPHIEGREGRIPVFGVARYRASIPYLALAPRQTFGDPETWEFFAGREFGHPLFITRQQWESGRNSSGEWRPPAGAELYEAIPAAERCVGEHSVTWNAALRVWLLVYNCTPYFVQARFAAEPWGPWSAPTTIFSLPQDPNAVCTLIQSAGTVANPNGCPNLRNYWNLPTGGPWPGFFYAPYVMERFTRDATQPGPGQPKRATIYWLLSTWNPYVVVVMQSTLQLQ